MKKIFGFTILVPILGFIILIGSQHLTRQAVPGQSSYHVKTNIIEKIIGYSKLTKQSKINYQVTLLENRLHEMVVLSEDNATSSGETISDITRLMNSYTNTAIDSLQSQSPNKETLDTTAKIANILRSAEAVAENKEEFATVSDVFSDARTRTRDLLEQTINSFVANTSKETIDNYIGSHIQNLGSLITSVAPHSKAQNTAIARIQDANDAIFDNIPTEAIWSLLRAEQAIALDAFLFDSERGPVNGQEIEAGPVPEGS